MYNLVNFAETQAIYLHIYYIILSTQAAYTFKNVFFCQVTRPTSIISITMLASYSWPGKLAAELARLNPVKTQSVFFSLSLYVPSSMHMYAHAIFSANAS